MSLLIWCGCFEHPFLNAGPAFIAVLSLRDRWLRLSLLTYWYVPRIKLHTSHIERLIALDNRRENIERLIIASMKRLESAISTGVIALQVVYDGRVADMDDLDKQHAVRKLLEGVLQAENVSYLF